ncbi:hypothetical protein A0H81_07033 [Grifola frondosa]|uniref:Transcription factor TFIIIC triple barrel domain-containing protein n=1 Tax=Grifola frondosa TaxID=5627 RepID=A0A1C7M8N7_GRIFR|nr:hypothetical protein A0H81_07033 [Grifola frondosa]
MSTSTLFPGYRQVETFGPDEDYEQLDGEIEEEVAYVTLDLGSIEPTLVPSSTSYRLIGLDTPTPYLQLSGTILKGQHQTLLGTELLFTEAKDDQHDRSKKSLVHIANTEQRICFKEVEFKEKDSAASAQPPENATDGTKKDTHTPVNQLVGNGKEQAPRGRGGGRKRGSTKSKSKGKGRVAEPVADEPKPPSHADLAEMPPEAMDTSEN